MIKIGDDQDVLLEKLVEFSPNIRLPQATVLLKNGTRLKGSLARKEPGVTALLGWFQISQDGQSQEIVTRLRALVTVRQWREVLALARSQQLTIAIREPIADITAGGDEPQTYAHRTWESAEVADIDEPHEGGTLELITLQ